MGKAIEAMEEDDRPRVIDLRVSDRSPVDDFMGKAIKAMEEIDRPRAIDLRFSDRPPADDFMGTAIDVIGHREARHV